MHGKACTEAVPALPQAQQVTSVKGKIAPGQHSPCVHDTTQQNTSSLITQSVILPQKNCIVTNYKASFLSGTEGNSALGKGTTAFPGFFEDMCIVPGLCISINRWSWASLGIERTASVPR